MNNSTKFLISVCFAFSLLAPKVRAQEVYHDSTALLILDHMGSFVGELNSVRFKSTTATDVAFSQNYLIKEFETSELIFMGPNKFKVKKKGTDKDEVFVYDGNQVSYYSFRDKNYAIADAPPTILETLDWMYESLGIELSLADFLYPDFTQKMIESMDYLEFLGRVEIGDENLFHVGGSNSEMTVQLWIRQDVGFTPAKIVLTYLDAPYARQVQVDFGNWEINPSIPDAAFDFSIPPGSRQITWASKN
jgi:hypothetical protein